MRIGIINIMPEAERYEALIAGALKAVDVGVEVVWLRLQTHNYRSSDAAHIDSTYVPVEAALHGEGLDGIVLTGAPVEHLSFDEVQYWPELKRLLSYFWQHTIPTMGLCWGGLALAHMLGLKKIQYAQKLFGVYQGVLLGESETFVAPQSRFAGLDDADLECLYRRREINLLGWSVETGYSILESTNHCFTIHLGHPEYDANRLVDEYRRDQKKGRADLKSPQHVNLENPKNTWQNHRDAFFGVWLTRVQTMKNRAFHTLGHTYAHFAEQTYGRFGVRLAEK